MGEQLRTIHVGTRGSDLALVQTRSVIAGLADSFVDYLIEEKVIVTTGDRHQKAAGPVVRDKVDWIKEIETALLGGEIQLAVHSGKDVPREVHPDTALLPVMRRSNPFDLLVFKDGALQPQSIAEALPDNALVGTASVRRKAQLLYLRPDLQVVEHRGNVPTRLQKLQDSSSLAAIVLAAAGVERLEIEGLSSMVCGAAEMLPAVNQGILVAQFLADDIRIREALQRLVDPDLEAAWTAERGVIRKLEADCGSAVAVYAESRGEQLSLQAQVFAPDGSKRIVVQQEGKREDAYALGEEAGAYLLAEGAAELL